MLVNNYVLEYRFEDDTSCSKDSYGKSVTDGKDGWWGDSYSLSFRNVIRIYIIYT